MKKEIKNSGTKVCPSCNAPNPSTAYACINCYQLMNKKYKVPFWKIHINHTVSALFLITVGLVGGMWFIKRCTEAVEAEMTIRIKTSEYQISVIAGKMKSDEGEGKNASSPDIPPESY